MKRTALLVALLALPGCLTECGAVGHGVIGRGVVSDGAISGGAVGGRPTAGGCTIPGSPVVFLDAATPGTGNVPADTGSYGLGEWTASGTPSYNATGGPDSTPAWENDGSASFYTRAADSSVADLTAGTMLAVWRIDSTVSFDHLFSPPPCQAVGGTPVGYRCFGATSGINLTGNTGEWQATAFRLNYTGSTDETIDLPSSNSATGGFATSFAVTTSAYNLLTFTTAYLDGGIALHALWDTDIPEADLLAYVQCRWPNTF